jgi:GAF domain-containing protein
MEDLHVPSDDGPAIASLGELAELAVDDQGLENTAEAVVALAMSTIGCEHAGLTVFAKGGDSPFTSMAPSDEAVELADKLQHELRQGPCVEAAWEQDTFVAGDLGADPRWPTWGPAAADLGLRSLLATRLTSGGQALGALNLYSERVREFDADDRDLAQVFALHAASTLLTVRERENLRVAVDARTLIGQAQGIIMERFGIDADRAFGVLRRYSQDRNIKIRALAEEVVRSRRLPSD